MLTEAEQEYVAGEEDFWYQNGRLSQSPVASYAAIPAMHCGVQHAAGFVPP